MFEASSKHMLVSGSGLNKNKKVTSDSRFYQGKKEYTNDFTVSQTQREKACEIKWVVTFHSLPWKKMLHKLELNKVHKPLNNLCFIS